MPSIRYGVKSAVQGRVYATLSLVYSESYPTKLLKIPPWTVKPAPIGATHETFVGPRCRSQLAPPTLGAVAENPKDLESSPAWTVSSRPHGEVSDVFFLR